MRFESLRPDCRILFSIYFALQALLFYGFILNLTTRLQAKIYTVNELFDNFSPRYQYHHTLEQVMDWFDRLGYSNIRKTWESKNCNGVAGTRQSGSKGGRP